MTAARPGPSLAGRPALPSATPRSRHGIRALAAVALSLVVAIGGVGGTLAGPGSTALDAPIRAFGWPADGVPNDAYFGLQGDLAPIGVPAAWTRTTGNAAVVVAVLDTGLDASNSEFAGRVVPGYNAVTNLADSPIDAAPTFDDNGHGTHVSGTIAASANNGAGIAGIAPSVSIMPIKVLGSNGEGDFGGLIAGMNWAIGHGARIITMSLGGELDPADATYLQAAFTAAHAAGAVVVAASGNDGLTKDEYPCNFTYVICVGSTTKDGSAVSSFSTRTQGLDLVAPGEQIASTLPGDDYGYGSGTSMATPHVTGAVALMRSVDPALSPDAVIATLIGSALPLVSGGHNPESGYGLLRAGAALDLLSGAPGPMATPIPTAPVGASPTPSASPGASPTPTPDPNASPDPIASPVLPPSLTPSPTPADPSLNPVPAPELIVPAVTASSPRNGARTVARSVKPRVKFNVPVTGVSVRTIRMKDLSTGKWVAIRVSYTASTRVATVIPVTRLAANHSYRITVGAVVSAAAGAPLTRPFVVTFRSGLR